MGSSGIITITMAPRTLLLIIAFALAATFTQAFVTAPTFSASQSTTSLDACRVNAKKEKRLRNRDNMRKFQKRGGSRKRIIKKQLASQERQIENEFIIKCFMTIPPPEMPEPSDNDRGRKPRY